MSTRLVVDPGVLSRPVPPQHVQFMPFSVKYDGETEIKERFTRFTEENTTKKCLENSVRGYPLEGSVLSVPEAYTGIVVETSREGLDPDQEKEGRVTSTFNSFTYWNYDRVPGGGDAYQQALQWIQVAAALHGPTTT